MAEFTTFFGQVLTSQSFKNTSKSIHMHHYSLGYKGYSDTKKYIIIFKNGNYILTVQPTVSLNYSQSIKINIGPSDGAK